ncbi:MAG: DNA cytosine methyltransferase [Chthoniobacterales bacterium]|nr:DNA cytosine methyltransferase [Chthoniobacterales bacterium]
MTAFYNEHDPYSAQWLRNLIAAGHIAPGVVDERDIQDIEPYELAGFTQVHMFAGIGVWSAALRRNGWPDDRPIWTGSAPCFPAGTLVLTMRGYVPIEDVLVGDDVLTHRARWRRVSATGSAVSPLVRVRGQGHWGLEATPSHPFLTGDDEWTPADKLSGKRWRTISEVPVQAIPPVENERGVLFDRGRWRATGWKNDRTIYLGRYASESEARARRRAALDAGEIDVRGGDGADPTTLGFARFLGYWVGDGWTSRDSVFLCGAKGDGPLLAEILSGAWLACSPSIERTTARARFGSKALVGWLNRHFGSGATEKRLPAWLHGAPEPYRAAFLSGYLEADGHREGAVSRWTTTSRALAIGVRVLLNQQRVSASITKHTPKRINIIQGRRVSERPFYRVTAYETARSFQFGDCHGIGFVRSVEPCEAARVYNLAVDGDESYTADGIVVHNCQPFSNAGKREGTKDARHLFPVWKALIAQCRPSVVISEQVASKDGREWLGTVSLDLEALGFAVGASDLCAAGFGEAHLRQRIYFVGLADDDDTGLEGRAGMSERGNQRALGPGGLVSGLEHPHVAGEQWWDAPGGKQPLRHLDCRTDENDAICDQGKIAERWRDVDWLLCRNPAGEPSWRPVESGTFPLAHGITNRMGKLRAYGNALDLETASAFVACVKEICNGI